MRERQRREPSWLDPSQVESVRVEGLSAAAAYGSEGAAGVIKIKTKPE
jgi:outer membrane receptor for ferrienterochelin and colicin